MSQYVIFYSSANSTERKMEYGEFASRDEARSYAKHRYGVYYESLMTREAWNDIRTREAI